MSCLFHDFHVDFMLPSAPVGRRHVGGWVVLPRREHEKQQKQRLFGDPGRSGAQGRFGAQISVTTGALEPCFWLITWKPNFISEVEFETNFILVNKWSLKHVAAM